VGRGGVLPTEQRPTVAQDRRCQGGILLPGDLSVTRELVVETGIAGGGPVRIDVPDAPLASSMSGNPEPYKRLAIPPRTPSKRARTARSSSRVNTIGRLAGFLTRAIPSSQPNPFLNICR